MIPRIGKAGYSFNGAKNYFLSNKPGQDDGVSRVAFTKTYNLSTDEPDKAFGYMAHTAMSVDEIKSYHASINGKTVSKAGRKSSNKVVYHYSLSWSPNDKAPTKEEMLRSGEETIELLQLSEHEAIIIGHSDTDHPHIHCIVNLISPIDGKKANPHDDRLKLSAWALEFEKKQGQIHCKKRVEEQEKRMNYNISKTELKNTIAGLYQASDNGKSFKVALESEGFILSKNDRRPFMMVDQEGRIFNLARLMEGVKTADLRNRFSDTNLDEFPNATDVSKSIILAKISQDASDHITEQIAEKPEVTQKTDKKPKQKDSTGLWSMDHYLKIAELLQSKELSSQLDDLKLKQDKRVDILLRRAEENFDLERKKEDFESVQIELEKLEGPFSKSKKRRLLEDLEKKRLALENAQHQINQILDKQKRISDDERSFLLKEFDARSIDELAEKLKMSDQEEKLRVREMQKNKINSKDNFEDPPMLN